MKIKARSTHLTLPSPLNLTVFALFLLALFAPRAVTAATRQISQPDARRVFPVGNAPRWVAFDGANIWVTNYFSNNVTKLRASDGAPQGTFNVGIGPEGIVFDGA